MNDRNHYFGAFLVIQVRERDRHTGHSQCPRGHNDPGPFCRRCGLPVTVEFGLVKEYPTQIYQLLPDDLADTLATITPAQMFGTGRIIARANSSVGVWMAIDCETRGEPISGFPTGPEINALTDALSDLPAVKALRAHPDVVSVGVEAGYVEDAEY